MTSNASESLDMPTIASNRGDHVPHKKDPNPKELRQSARPLQSTPRSTTMPLDHVTPEPTSSPKLKGAPSDGFRVLIADDHRMIGEILGHHLSITEGFQVHHSHCFESTLKEIRAQCGFEVVMLDYRMPGMQGIDSVARIVEANLPGRTMLLSGYVDSYTLNRAIKVGVRGLIPKSMSAASVGKIVSLVHTGEVFIPAGEHTNQHLSGRFASLSDVERLVLAQAARGCTNKQIADDSGESEANIKRHMRLLCRKLGARNRAHAAILGREMNLFF
jgi:two-component system, NarL family, nitrate/nitrite response regulator NarL